MSLLKDLLGLEDSSLTEGQIMEKIREAYKKNLNEIEFLRDDGEKVIIKI